MAERFAREGRLVACGTSPAARSDARHVAVEFVHPVIVGKRALPALAFPSSLEIEPHDIAIVFDGDVPSGCLTIGFGAGAEWDFAPPVDDPYVRQELVETLYHVLWELVHVFIEHRESRGEDAGAAGFL